MLRSEEISIDCTLLLYAGLSASVGLETVPLQEILMRFWNAGVMM